MNSREIHKPTPRTSEAILSDEAVSAAVELLQAAKLVRRADPVAIAEIARIGSTLVRMAQITEAALKQRQQVCPVRLVALVQVGGDL